MLTRVLFGVQRSPHRAVCVVLAWIVSVLGVGLGVAQGWPTGLPVAMIGLLAVAVLARQTAAHHERTQTRAQLSSHTADRDDEALRQMVEHSPHDPNRQLAKVTAEISAKDIEDAIAKVRH